MDQQSNFTPPAGDFGFSQPMPESMLKAAEKATKKDTKGIVHEHMRNLERENIRLRFAVDKLKADLATLEQKNSVKVEFANRLESTKTLRTQIQDHQKKMEEFEKTIADLKRDLESEREELKRAEEANETLNSEVAELKDKVKTTEGHLTTAKNTITEHEANIEALEKQIGEADEAAEEKQKSYDALDEKYKKAKEDLEVEQEKSKANLKLADTRAEDNLGISKQLTEKTTELDTATKERDDLQVLEDARKETEKDLKEARDLIKALNDQIAKFKTDTERRPFDFGPTAYTTRNPTSDEPVPETPSLNTELEKLFAEDTSTPRLSSGATSEAASDDGDRPHSPVTAGDDDTLRVDQPAPGSQQEPQVEIRTEVRTEIREATRNQVIFTPFEVSAHNPLLCWIQTEHNYIILFSVWVHLFFNLASRWVRRCSGSSRRSASAPADDFDVSPPVNAPVDAAVDAPDTTQGDSVDPLAALLARAHSEDQQLAEAARLLPDIEEKPDTREVIGDPVPPESPYQTNTRHMHAQTGGQSVIDPLTDTAASIDPQNRAWYAKIVSPLPNEIPEVKKTLFGMAFHLLVYYSIFLGIYCYYERKMWIDANDHTRAFVQQLLHNPRNNQNLVQYLAHPLPEHWKHNIDVFIFKYFVEKFGLHANYVMPG